MKLTTESTCLQRTLRLVSLQYWCIFLDNLEETREAWIAGEIDGEDAVDLVKSYLGKLKSTTVNEGLRPSKSAASIQARYDAVMDRTTGLIAAIKSLEIHRLGGDDSVAVRRAAANGDAWQVLPPALENN